MEHNEAVRLQAVEKYILGELPPAARDEFEAHYFDCAVCSFDLRAGVAFAAGARQFFTEVPAPSVVLRPSPRGWFAWLKPAFAVPVFAALLLLVGYQNLITIPGLQQGASTGIAAVDPWFSLRASNVKGPVGEKFQIRSGQAFSLFVDVTTVSHEPDSSFLLQLKDSSGKILRTRSASAVEAKRPVLFFAPAGLQEGEYNIAILEQDGGSTKEVSRIPFTIAFSAQVEQH